MSGMFLIRCVNDSQFVVIYSERHVTHALHSAVLSVHQWDGHESKAYHSRVCECQSGQDNHQDNHRSKEMTGSKKESIILITSVSIFVYLHRVQSSICYVCFIVLHFVLFNPSLSQSSCLTAVSNSVESSARLQALHQLSTSLSVSVATLISRTAASAAASILAPVIGEAAAQVAKSIQSLTVAHNKHEELNNNGQAQIIGYALSLVEVTQKDFQRTIDQLRVTKEHSRNDSMLRCLIKSQMAEAVAGQSPFLTWAQSGWQQGNYA